LCHTRTKNLTEIIRSAEILVVAVGSPHFLKGDWLSPDCVVIDVGINYVEGKLVGDVDAESVGPKAAYLTPVPGGVGPVTSIFALFQFVRAYHRRIASTRSGSR
ncbi:MAG: bifunctional methylenetetrahydrofolate dehydrogenase/methenyltetrahydrofolate cyclohydrolase, partial [bacterium]